MSMSSTRYNYLRERALFLYNILNNRMYNVWIAPRSMMTVDQLRDRDYYRQEGVVGDADYYERLQKRGYKVPQIIDLLANITEAGEIGFENANHVVVEIYESIQEYIALWCEFIMSAPEFHTPPRTELRALESLAYYIFPMYREIKPFTDKLALHKQLKEDEALNRKGLMGLAMLFNYNKGDTDISFISHLDDLQGHNDFGSVGFDEPTPVSLPKDLTDSLGSTEWIFKG